MLSLQFRIRLHPECCCVCNQQSDELISRSQQTTNDKSKHDVNNCGSFFVYHSCNLGQLSRFHLCPLNENKDKARVQQTNTVLTTENQSSSSNSPGSSSSTATTLNRTRKSSRKSLSVLLLSSCRQKFQPAAD